MDNTSIKVKEKSSIDFKGSMKKFGSGIMPTLSKMSKAFLLPIALLPIAGVFLGIGAAITSKVTDTASAGYLFGSMLNQMGSVCFGNLPLLFCISVAMAYTKDSGVAAITAVIGFLVMNGMQAAFLSSQTADDANKTVTWSLLWIHKIPDGLITANAGVNSLNTGVFAGVFCGAIAAKCYNKFHQTQLPSMISFFSGTKLVPIVCFFAVIPLSFIFMFLWPYIGIGLDKFGTASGKLPGGLDSFIFEVVERSLVPFGLHHVFYSPLWWTNAGGSVFGAFNDATAAQKSTFAQSWIAAHQAFASAHNIASFDDILKFFASNKADLTKNYGLSSADADQIVALWGAQGDQTMMFKVMAGSSWLNFGDLHNLGLNVGRFQAGKYGFMLFGLPCAALGMWFNVPKENRKQVMGIYFSAAFTSFLTGITEPIEYTFLFLAPWLFYGVHMPLAAISFLLTGLLQTHLGNTVSGGLIDYIIFGLIPYSSGVHGGAIHVFGVLIVAVGMGPLYFVAFYYGVKFGDVKVPGREGDATGAKLATKADYKASKGLNVDGSKIEEGTTSSSEWTDSKDVKEIARMEKAAKIIEFLGGEANITDVDSCASRLRLTVIDGSLVDKEGIKSLGGSTGTLVKGNNVQVVYGGEQEAIKPRMLTILAKQRADKKAA